MKAASRKGERHRNGLICSISRKEHSLPFSPVQPMSNFYRTIREYIGVVFNPPSHGDWLQP